MSECRLISQYRHSTNNTTVWTQSSLGLANQWLIASATIHLSENDFISQITHWHYPVIALIGHLDKHGMRWAYSTLESTRCPTCPKCLFTCVPHSAVPACRWLLCLPPCHPLLSGPLYQGYDSPLVYLHQSHLHPAVKRWNIRERKQHLTSLRHLPLAQSPSLVKICFVKLAELIKVNTITENSTSNDA